MEEFTGEHAKLLLEKEWMAKTDAATSVPYLFKLHFSPTNLSCVMMITDTKKVWAEVLNDKQLARRWRAHNTKSPQQYSDTNKEEVWREQILELLSNSHTLGGILELAFEVVKSNYSDLCLEMECEAFKWRWETNFLGYQQSAKLISKHLIFPLISLNHLAFSAAEVIGEMSDTDVERTVDKLGRTARRTIDTHIKNALSKPRLATCINRMTALFNFLPDLPRVISVPEKPLLVPVEEPEVDAIPELKPSKGKERQINSPKPPVQTEPQKYDQAKPVAGDPDSVTESDDDEPAIKHKPASRVGTVGPSVEGAPLQHPPRVPSTPIPGPTEDKLSSESDSPQRPIKKIKPSVPDSSDDDSEHEQKKTGGLGGGVKRSTRQPIKRGGKRF